MEKAKIVSYLRNILAVETSSDPVLKATTDEELLLLLETSSKSFGLEIEEVEDEDIPLLVCSARREMYWKLATNSAPFYPLNVDGISLSKNVRFDHYMSLIMQMDKEYDRLYSQSSIGSKITVGRLLNDKPYNARARKIHFKEPKNVQIKVDKQEGRNLYISINYGNLKKEDILRTNIYTGEQQIWNKYSEQIDDRATKVFSVDNPSRLFFMLDTLKFSNKYYVLMEIELKQGIKIYKEIEGVINGI